MAAITGSQTKLILKKATTFGTEVAASTLDAMGVQSFTPSQSSDTIEGNSLGTGLVMEVNQEVGNVGFTAALNMVAGYQNGFDVLLAQLFGDPATPAEQTTGEGDYLHVISMSTENAENGWVNIARLLTSTVAQSFPACAVTGMTLTAAQPTTGLVAAFSLICSDAIRDSAVNTVAVINAATLKDQTSIIVKNESEWLINEASDSALSSGDRVAITNWVLSLNRPLATSPEIKGTAGNGEFVSDGFVNGTLAITMSKLDAMTFFDGADDGTYFKGSFIVEGAQIGAGENKLFQINFPRLKLLTQPDYALAVPGNNPVDMTFQIFAADAAPSGMSSVYPQVSIINEKSTSY